MRQSLFQLLLAFAVCGVAQSQTIVFQEKFDECGVLPTGWGVLTPGNPTAVWYVGTPLNNDSDSTSMDGTCCFIVDDDATGDNTPAYVLTLFSPTFDCSQFGTNILTTDVHYRDWDQAQEFMEIIVSDGNNAWTIARFDDNNSTGSQFHEFVTLKVDLGLMTNSKEVQILVRYDDAAGFNWWAGIDNVKVEGFDTGTNVLFESFNNCAQPIGWETQIIAGEDDWFFGYADNPNANPNSMNGSCFAFFDDDVLGATDTTPNSRVRLISPWFDGSEFAEYKLYFDLIQRDWQAGQLSLYVQNGDGDEKLAQEWLEDVGGPQFDDYQSLVVDLSPFRHKQMRLVFEFWDGEEWGWWTGFDNIKIAGKGQANDLCQKAKTIVSDIACEPADNRTAVFEGPQPPCSKKNEAGLWYSWQADFSGFAKASVGSDFNDVLTVFTGGCADLQISNCFNRDEYGFTSESPVFQVVQGQTYLLRVSGEEDNFGKSKGSFCLKIEQVVGQPALPNNDDCANAKLLSVNSPCQTGNNRNALVSSKLPSLSERARAEIWYRFVAPTLAPGEQLEFRSNADFSDIITCYSGSCLNLTEVAGNVHGSKLLLENLLPGETHLISVTGNLATIEGSVCAELVKFSENAPANDDCFSPENIAVNGNCVAGNNLNASFSGHRPPCVVSVEKDIWFKFVAPSGGGVRVNTGADFEHVLAVWKGSCDSLVPVFCTENPLRCNGYAFVGGLENGQEYFLQISSWASPSGYSAGEVCVRILPGSAMPDFQPLALEVEQVCTGVGTAVLEISPKNGVQPYVFAGNQAGVTLNSGDHFIVVVTDAMGCEQTFSGIVKECTEAACALSTSISVLSNPCNLNDGSLQANVAGGVSPYGFEWSSPGGNAAVLSGLSAGNYTVKITDANGCTSTVAASLQSPEPIAVSASIKNESEGLSDGKINIEPVFPNADYQYEWSFNGQPFATTPSIENLSAGTYTLTVTDLASGCTKVQSYEIQNVVAVEDLPGNFYAEISPNPAYEKTFLTLRLPSAEKVAVQIFDAAGRQVREMELGEAVLEKVVPLDLNLLPGGFYEVKIRAGVGVRALKLVVSK